jgi:hypothetical protein
MAGPYGPQSRRSQKAANRHGPVNVGAQKTDAQSMRIMRYLPVEPPRARHALAGRVHRCRGGERRHHPAKPLTVDGIDAILGAGSVGNGWLAVGGTAEADAPAPI